MKKANSLAKGPIHAPTAAESQSRAKKKEFQYAYLIEAVLLLLLLGGGTIFTLNYLKRDTARNTPLAPRPIVKIPELNEAEGARVLSKSREFSVRVQDMSPFRDGTWSNNQQLFVTDAKPGDWIELAMPDHPGRVRLAVFLTKSFDYGIVRFSVNGKPIGPDLDLYSGGQVLATGPVFLGNVTLKAKENVMRVEVVGANSAMTPPRYFFGIDGFRFDPAKD